MDFSADWRADADHVAALGRRLREAGIAADRLVLFRRSLHPEILGRATAWAPDRPIEIFDRSHGLDLSSGFAGSPLERAMAGGLSQRLQRASFERTDWRWAKPLQGLGLIELVIRPFRQNAGLAAGTRQPEGFAASALDLLERLTKTRSARTN
jgi:adenylate cyclase